MITFKSISSLIVLAAIIVAGCSDATAPNTKASDNMPGSMLSANQGNTGVLTTNGWYEEEEIYYINKGIEEGVTERGENDIYLIGGDRLHQANVVELIPGEAGYSPHWNVYIVHSAAGVTVQEILDSGYASSHYNSEGVLFDDVRDLRAALKDGLVTFDRPGVVVLCPIISEAGADAPGNTALSEDFEPFGTTF